MSFFNQKLHVNNKVLSILLQKCSNSVTAPLSNRFSNSMQILRLTFCIDTFARDKKENKDMHACNKHIKDSTRLGKHSISFCSPKPAFSRLLGEERHCMSHQCRPILCLCFLFHHI